MKTVFLFIGFLCVGFLLTLGVSFFILPKIGIRAVKQQASVSLTTFPTSAFSLQNAPSESIKGTIASMSGTVLWQSRTATESSPLAKPIVVQQGELIQTGADGTLIVTLPKSSIIHVFPNSQINFIQTIPASVVLQQDYGDIAYTKTGAQPLSARSLHLLTEIDDGTAEIITDRDTSTVSILIRNGSVKVAYNDANNTSSVTTIPTNTEFTFDDTTRQTSILPIK